ncbi:hypothetical protein [Pseudoprimorskyibacter insulae]|uniref:N-acetyltransferase domain-containing protein n=1 Tax=Pseudoprimorskyibacter insulae TaxID=1695997 RepID=A0A2R8AZ81_9RHOB|nr:hypothetical protein [Pseudoprimorskyibacter insulae]SPF81345.1 hypothetical protein PRI8871_03168 [Pseudoprimorskyibacter insulae]
MDADQLELSQLMVTSQLLERLSQGGYSLRMPADFSEVPALVETTGRERQMPMMDVTRHDFTQGTAFWLFLEKDGEVIGGAAARLEDLGSETYPAFLSRIAVSYYGAIHGQSPVENVARPVVDLLKGRLVYIGELQIKKGHQGDMAAVKTFMKILMSIAASKWRNFDAMYAFVSERHRLLAVEYGFTVQVKNAIRWRNDPPPGWANSHRMVVLRRVDFENEFSGRLD